MIAKATWLPAAFMRVYIARFANEAVRLRQLWRHALEWTAEKMLAGFAGIRGRCTVMGRAAMSLDLQQVCPHSMRRKATSHTTFYRGRIAVVEQAASYRHQFSLACVAGLERSSDACPSGGWRRVERPGLPADSRQLRQGQSLGYVSRDRSGTYARYRRLPLGHGLHKPL